MDEVLTANLIGPSNEVNVRINGIEVQGLLDTGATVSTISRNCYEDNLKHIAIQPLQSVLKIECADGQLLPYDGLVEADVWVDGLDDLDNTLVRGLFLVVPSSQYNHAVSVLLGTNIMSTYIQKAKNAYGDRFLQKTRLTNPWYTTFKCLNMRESEIRKNNWKLAIVKLAGYQPVTLRPNSETIIKGYLDRKLPYNDTCAIIQPTKHSSVPDDLDITASMIPYSYASSSQVNIAVSNLSTRTVTLQPRAILCEIQPVTVEDISDLTVEDSDPLQDIKICIEDLSEEEI